MEIYTDILTDKIYPDELQMPFEYFSYFSHQGDLSPPISIIMEENSPEILSPLARSPVSHGILNQPLFPKDRKLDLLPSCFENGCICGHNIEFRDLVETQKRKNTRRPGVTIRPKTPPIAIKLE